MIFRLTRSTGLPLILEPEEVETLKTLELQGRWTELEIYEKELKEGDGLTILMLEAKDLEELRFFLNSIDSKTPFIINFQDMTIIIDDNRSNS